MVSTRRTASGYEANKPSRFREEAPRLTTATATITKAKPFTTKAKKSGPKRTQKRTAAAATITTPLATTLTPPPPPTAAAAAAASPPPPSPSSTISSLPYPPPTRRSEADLRRSRTTTTTSTCRCNKARKRRSKRKQPSATAYPMEPTMQNPEGIDLMIWAAKLKRKLRRRTAALQATIDDAKSRLDDHIRHSKHVVAAGYEPQWKEAIPRLEALAEQVWHMRNLVSMVGFPVRRVPDEEEGDDDETTEDDDDLNYDRF